MSDFGVREGEQTLAEDPALADGDARIVLIGRIVSPWTARETCPKNMREARERGAPASVLVDPAYRPGLAGLERTSHLVILSWLGRAPRNLIVQKPRHAPAARGTFALRSPARPNPVGLHVARLLRLDVVTGRLDIDGIDVLDGTPVIDIKPYYASTDAIPDAVTGSASA
ncbi:MAG: tRNA (N6-threonylcarbamoyladenosine(37)-N6)-methyltransferase TrmO [Pseudorhodoplanes sp.]